MRRCIVELLGDQPSAAFYMTVPKDVWISSVVPIEVRQVVRVALNGPGLPERFETAEGGCSMVLQHGFGTDNWWDVLKEINQGRNEMAVQGQGMSEGDSRVPAVRTAVGRLMDYLDTLEQRVELLANRLEYVRERRPCDPVPRTETPPTTSLLGELQQLANRVAMLDQKISLIFDELEV